MIPSTYYLPTPDSLQANNNLSHLLRQALASINAMLNEQSAPLGLTAMQWRPLVLIRYAGLGTAGELARRENTDTGAMTRTLDRLEAKGLLYRERCPIDRRVMKLKLSPTGENVCEAILPLVADSLNLHVAGFSDDEIQLCLRLLQRIIANGALATETSTRPHV